MEPMRSIAFGSSWPGLVSRFGLLFLLLMLVGCGPGEGKVSGQVKFGGAPLPGGIVLFQPVGPQNSVSIGLDEQGNYEVVLPAGEVRVSVDNRMLQPHEPPIRGGPPNLLSRVGDKIAAAKKENAPPPKAAGSPNQIAAQKNPGKYVKIPDKYHDVSTSGLNFTVQRGNQTHNIELTK
jgi:hypothetical protein